MLDRQDYLIGWAIYIVAGILCYMIFYRFTGVIRFKPIANSLRAILLALMFTPWYVSPEEDLMAPALMVMMLDLITQGGTTFVRAMVPLSLSLCAAVIIGLSWGLLKLPFRKFRSAGPGKVPANG